jgi:hypothetical protein
MLFRSVTHRRGGARHGLVTSFNDESVYVLYNGDLIALPSPREDLDWSHPDLVEAEP